MIYVTGDTHADIDIKKVVCQELPDAKIAH